MLIPKQMVLFRYGMVGMEDQTNMEGELFFQKPHCATLMLVRMIMMHTIALIPGPSLGEHCHF